MLKIPENTNEILLI